MSLPEESVAANTLPEVTTIPTGKKLIFTDPDTNEGGIITLENLSKQILQNLTSQTFALDQGNLTLLQALNQLNSKRFKANSYIIYSDGSTKTVSVKWGDTNSHMTSFLLIDNNRITSLYITGKLSGVTEILKKPEYAVPPVLDASSATLKVTLGSWSTALLICLESVTIS